MIAVLSLAHASVCPPPPPTIPNHLFGRPGAANLELPVFELASPDELYVTDATNARVPMRVVRQGVGYAVVAPEAGWVPGAEYDVAAPYHGLEFPVRIQERVEEVDAPNPPTFEPWRFHSDFVAAVGIDLESPLFDAVYVELEVDVDPSFTNATRIAGQEASLGVGLLCSYSVLLHPDAPTHWVRARTVTLVGGVSDWVVAEVPREVPDTAEASGGCAVVGAGSRTVAAFGGPGPSLRDRDSGASALLAGVLALGLRRRSVRAGW
ncbi:MAG: hypothetical protein R3F61_31505 [Myxococcota bacterium]